MNYKELLQQYKTIGSNIRNYSFVSNLPWYAGRIRKSGKKYSDELSSEILHVYDAASAEVSEAASNLNLVNADPEQTSIIEFKRILDTMLATELEYENAFLKSTGLNSQQLTKALIAYYGQEGRLEKMLKALSSIAERENEVLNRYNGDQKITKTLGKKIALEETNKIFKIQGTKNYNTAFQTAVYDNFRQKIRKYADTLTKKNQASEEYVKRLFLESVREESKNFGIYNDNTNFILDDLNINSVDKSIFPELSSIIKRLNGIKTSREKLKQVNFKISYKQYGMLNEALGAIVGNAFGAYGFKMDSLQILDSSQSELILGEVNAVLKTNNEITQDDKELNSKIVEHMNTMKKLLDGINGGIAIISAKDYSAAAFNNKTGPTAGNMQITNYCEMVNQGAGVNFNADDLIFIIGSIGKNWLNSENSTIYKQVFDFLALTSVYLIFDDIFYSLTDSFKNNIDNKPVPHFLQINGLFIPFSVYLQQLKTSLEKRIYKAQSRSASYAKWVNITINHSTTAYQGEKGHSASLKDWKAQAEKKRDISIRYEIMGGLFNYLQSLGF